MLPPDSRCNSWRIGETNEILRGSQICTPALDELKANPKRAARYGNKSANMNTISSLTTPDLTTAFAIETRAHAFPWSEKPSPAIRANGI